MSLYADDLFFRQLISSYVDNNRRFVRRGWLVDRLRQALDADAPFVLLTAEPGAGKTAFLAQLASDHPDWPRYFIRRDQRSVLADVSTSSFLLRVGYQLAALCPTLFQAETLRLSVQQKLDTVAEQGEAVGAEVKRLVASPFYAKVLEIEQLARNVQGRLVGLRVDELVVEPRLLAAEDLLELALFHPARALARMDPGRRIVILIDALDEIRHHATQDNILAWLTTCPALPPNIRFVLSSRPLDDALRRFCDQQSGRVSLLAITEDDEHATRDVRTFVDRLLGEPALALALVGTPGAARAFADKAVSKAKGNLGYLDAVARGIDRVLDKADPTPLHALLALHELPPDLAGLYAFFLHQIKAAVARERIELADPATGERYDKPVWPAVYQPMLAVLAVGLEPLNLDTLITLGDIRAERSTTADALDRLRQFLDAEDRRLSFYHATVAEFLTAEATRDTPDLADLYVDARQQNGRVADVLWRARAAHWEALDGYGFASLATHLARAGDLARLVALIDRDWMFARVERSGGTFGGYVADVDVALQAVASQPRPMRVELCRLHVARQLAAARIDAYALEDLLILVSLGRSDEALAHARLQSDPTAVFGVLIATLTASQSGAPRRVALVDAAVAAVGAIPSEADRFAALCRLGPMLAGLGDRRRSQAALDEAYALAFRLVPTVALPDLAAALAKSGDERATLVFADARREADALDYDPDSMHSQRPHARLALVDALLCARRMPDALSVAESMHEDMGLFVDDALRNIAAAMAEAGECDDALVHARRIGEETTRVVALCNIAAAMRRFGANGSNEIVNEACEVAARARDRGFVARSIIALATLGALQAAVGDPRAQDVLERATELFRNEGPGLFSDMARPTLAEQLARAGRTDEALRVAGKDRRALRATAFVLAEAGDPDAKAVFDQLRAEASASSGAVSRAPIEFARALAASGHVDAALQLAPFAGWDYGRDTILAIAAEGLVSGRCFDEARDVIGRISATDLKAEAMTAMAARSSAGVSGPDFVAAETLVGQNGDRRRHWVLALAQAGEDGLALRASSATTDPSERGRLENDLIGALAAAGHLDRALGLAAGIGSACSASTWVQLVEALCAECRCDEAERASARLRDSLQAAQAFRIVASARGRDNNASGARAAFTRALGAASRVHDTRERTLELVAISEAMARANDERHRSVMDQAVTARQTLQGWERDDATRCIAVAMAHVGDARADALFDEALQLSYVWTGPDGRETKSSMKLKQAIEALIEADRLDQAREAVSRLEAGDRVEPLVALGKALWSKQDRRAAAVLHDARMACEHLTDEPHRLMQIERVANAMAECNLLHEALIAARPHHLDRYLGHLAAWAPIFEREEPGLSYRVLCAATEVAAWYYPAWQQIDRINRAAATVTP